MFDKIYQAAFNDELEKIAKKKNYEGMNLKTLLKHQVKEFGKGGFNNPKFVAINKILDRREHL